MVSQRSFDPERPPIELVPWSNGKEARGGLGTGIAGSGALESSFCLVVLHGASDLVRTPRRLEGYSREAESESGMCCCRSGSRGTPLQTLDMGLVLWRSGSGCRA